MTKHIIQCIFFLGLLISVSPVFAQSKAELQKDTDDKILTEYFTKNDIHPVKTASGLYYLITKEGTGNKPHNKQQVSVNYTGKTMDGRMFDSNVDPGFNHTEPLQFHVGMGTVLKGWDEGLLLMNAGSKATFYIPSGLAYGEKSIGLLIPSNSILIFDIDLLSVGK